MAIVLVVDLLVVVVGGRECVYFVSGGSGRNFFYVIGCCGCGDGGPADSLNLY